MRRAEVVVLCGGFGVRMYELTLETQKCMLQVQGYPILEHLLRQIATVFRKAKVIFLVGYESRSVMSYFGKSYEGLQLAYAPESTKGSRLALILSSNMNSG